MGKVTVKIAEQNHSSSATHRTLEKSSTLARKYVRKPAAVRTMPKTSTVTASSANAVVAKPITKVASAPRTSASAVRARQIELRKRQAQARATVSHQPVTSSKARPTVQAKERAAKSAARSTTKIDSDAPKMKSKRKSHRVLIATFCSAVTVAALFFFVQTNMPDITVRVAALQTGIDASYPSYIPRGYSLKTVTAEKDGSITMYFTGEGDNAFTLTEEKSSWDSTSLLNNFVKSNYSSKYATLRERGVTVYVDSGKATWVNGGLLFKVTSKMRNLSKEQILNLVSSI